MVPEPPSSVPAPLVHREHLDPAIARQEVATVLGRRNALIFTWTPEPFEWLLRSEENSSEDELDDFGRPFTRSLRLAWGGRVRLRSNRTRTVICDGANEWTETKWQGYYHYDVRPARESAVCMLSWLVDRGDDVGVTGVLTKAGNETRTVYTLERGGAVCEMTVEGGKLSELRAQDAIHDNIFPARSWNELEPDASSFVVTLPKGTKVSGTPLPVPPVPPEPAPKKP